MSIKQKLIWLPEEEQSIIDVQGNFPNFLWSLPLQKDKDHKPELPYIPNHRDNAFLEDIGHDWFIADKSIRYRSSATGGKGSVWILLEYVIDDNSKCPQCSADIGTEARFCGCCGICLITF